MSNIYERLVADHEYQRFLLKHVANTQGDSEERREFWRQLKIELEAHASAEEQVFYAELMAHADGSDKARHSVAEHQEAADLIKEIDDIDMSSPAWLPKFKALRDRIEHHVDEEETEIFPAARRLIDMKRAENLVHEFNQRKPAEEQAEAATI